MNSLAFFQNINSDINSDIISFFNFVLSAELAIACICGMWQGCWFGEASASKIALLATITAIMFHLWQSWPQQLVLLTVLPQCAFWVFAGASSGCVLRWVFDQTVARN
jgi:hypothetical protein